MAPGRTVVLASVALALGGCAVIANYDFGKYGEDPRDGGAGGLPTTSSSSSSAGASGSSTSSGSPTSSSSTSSGSMSSSTSSSGACGSGSIAGQVLKDYHAGPAAVGSVAVDATAVYYTQPTSQPSIVARADKANPTAGSTFGLQTDNNARGLLLDATYAYWITTAAPPDTGDTLWRIPKVFGTSGTRLYTSKTGIFGGVALGNGLVYFTSSNESSTPGIFAVSGPGSLLQAVFPFPAGQVPGEIVLDGSSIYATVAIMPGVFNIVAIDPAAKTSTNLANGELKVSGLAVAGSYVYWSSSSGVRRVAKTGGAAPQVLTSSATPCGGLALVPGYLYCTDNGSGSVVQLDLTTATPSLVTAGNAMTGVAVDCDAIYLGDGPQIERIPRQ